MERKVIFPRALQCLMAIAEHGSYTRAAEALHVSQPSLSQQIKQLEMSLSLPLLVRSKRTVRLTDAGEVYLRYARRAYSELSAGTRAVQEVQDLSRGSLCLGWTPITDYLTCSLLQEFHRLYPGITLSTLEMPTDEIETAVVESHIDIGIAFSTPAVTRTASDDLQKDILFEEPLCVAVGGAHAMRANKPAQLSAAALAEESLILLNTDFALRQQVAQYCAHHNVVPHVAIETDSLSVIIEIVHTSTLATVLPSGILQTQSGLYPVALTPALPNQSVTIISGNNGYQSPASLAFRALASNWAAQQQRQTCKEPTT